MPIDVTSPQSGLVIACHVAVGDAVAVDTALVTVETMKCERVITSPIHGVVTSVIDVGALVGAAEAVVSITDRRSPGPKPSAAVSTPPELIEQLTANGLGMFEPFAGGAPGDAGVVAGIMRGREVQATGSEPLSPIERVWIAGDRAKSMGAISEAECRLIITAFDVAEEQGLPVEWVALSGGARISLESGTENMDWCAAVVRRIVQFTQRGGRVIVIVAGVNVGAQSYWNAEATMLNHCAGLLVMVDGSSMILTGHRALAIAGGDSENSDGALGGYDGVMGHNGEAHHRAPDIASAYRIVFAYHRLFGTTTPTTDPVDRDICVDPYQGPGDRHTVGAVLEGASNPGRKVPFAIRPVMASLVDRDAARAERWQDHAEAEGAVVWDSRIGGYAATLIGIESHPRPAGEPGQPDWWAGAALYPQAAKKIARAINAASGHRPVVVLANLAGFDGSRWSLRNQQLEWGAELARSVVNFEGPIVVVIIGRFHGGAYVVFNRQLNDQLRMVALEGTRVSVIGGSVAATVALDRAVRARAAELAAERGVEVDVDLLSQVRSDFARKFDEEHSVDRALANGSVDEIITPTNLRPTVIRLIAPSPD